MSRRTSIGHALLDGGLPSTSGRALGAVAALVAVCMNLSAAAEEAPRPRLVAPAATAGRALPTRVDLVVGPPSDERRLAFGANGREFTGIAGTSCLQPSQNCQAPDGANGLTSTTGLFRVADDVDVLIGGNITNVCWYGMYANGGVDCGGTAVDAFTIRILNDNNGIPGPVAGTFTQGTNLVVTRSTTGVTLPFGSGLAEYNYSGALSGTFVNALANNCYWIEIVNGLSGCTWFWETGTGPGLWAAAVQDGDNAYTTLDVINNNMALCLNLQLQDTTAQPCAPSPPANDECANAVVLATTGVQTVVDLRGATNNPSDPPFSCRSGGPGNGSGSVWYRFTATLSSHRINTCNSPGTDSLIAVYAGSCGSLIEIACNDDDCGLLSDLVVGGLTAGVQYYVQLAAFDDANRGVYSIEVGPPISCQDHLPSGGYIIVPTNNGATPVWDDFRTDAPTFLSRFEVTSIFWNGVNGAGANVTVPSTSVDVFALQIYTYNPTTGLPDTLVATRSTLDGNLSIVSRTGQGIGFDFNGAMAGGFAEFQRYVLNILPVNLPNAGCYWFAVYNELSGQPVQWWMLGGPRAVMDAGNGNSGWDGDNDGLQLGDILSYDWIWCFDSLNLVDPTSCIDASPPVNDECANALVIPCNGVGENRDVDLRFATPNGSDPIPSCLGTPLFSSVWYRVTTGPGPSSLLIQTCNTNSVGVNDSAVAVYTGTCFALTEVACANDNCGAGPLYEEIRIDPALPNTDYYILVGGVDEFAQLFYELDVTCPAPPLEPNDDCDDALALTLGVPVSGSTLHATLDANAVSAGPCNGIGVATKGVWYSVVGNGSTFEVNTCTLTTIDTLVTVFCAASCDGLNCVSADDDGCGPVGGPSRVQWCAAAGAQYLILVHNFPGENGGSFEIVVNDIGPVGCTPDPECFGFDPTACEPLDPPYFTIDEESRVGPLVVFSAADVLQTPGPTVFIPAANMSLLFVGDEVDGISFDHPGVGPGAQFVLRFSVDRVTDGEVAPDPVLVGLGLPYNVQHQAALNQAAADEYVSLLLFTRAGPILPFGPPTRNNTMTRNQSDAGGVDYSLLPAISPDALGPGDQSNTDGGATPPGSAFGPPTFIFFSLDRDSVSLGTLPGSTGSGADIFVDNNTGAAGGENLYVSRAALGLLAADDIDALNVFDNGNRVFNAGQDEIVFSLAQDSPSLAGRSPADIFRSQGGGVFQPYSVADDLGLLDVDDVDSLEISACSDVLECVQRWAIGTICTTGGGCPGSTGDANCDGGVDFFDIDPFLLALFQPGVYAATYCNGSLCAADMNCDGAVNFFDIDGFLQCLFGMCVPCLQ